MQCVNYSNPLIYLYFMAFRKSASLLLIYPATKINYIFLNSNAAIIPHLHLLNVLIYSCSPSRFFPKKS
jgi:hypothetical protein